MKTLYLVRHAKSSWKDLKLDDFERPLNKRGKRDAPFMGQVLKEKGIQPDLIAASSAKRTRKTARIIAEQMGYPEKNIVLKKQLYEATENALLKFIQQTDDSVNTLMLVGHNPELTGLSNLLCDYFIYNIPTAGVSCISFQVKSWEEVGPKIGNHVFFDYPKRYFRKDAGK